MIGRFTALLVVVLTASSCAGQLQSVGPHAVKVQISPDQNRPQDEMLDLREVSEGTFVMFDGHVWHIGNQPGLHGGDPGADDAVLPWPLFRPGALPSTRVSPVLWSAPYGAGLSAPFVASGTWSLSQGTTMNGWYYADHTSAGAQEGIFLFNCLDCWIKGVRSVNSPRQHVWVYQSAEPRVIGPLVMGRAWTDMPPKVESGDAVPMWMLPNGSPVVNLAVGGDRIHATENALNVYDKALLEKIQAIANVFLCLALVAIFMLVLIHCELVRKAARS